MGGEELPKLFFYRILMCAYFVLLLVWGLWAFRWKKVLFKIHHYITLAVAVGLVEAICMYASLYHWNYLGHRWWSMMFLAALGTVLKQSTCYGLLYLGCFGLGVTKPRLETPVLVKGAVLIVLFVLAEFVRGLTLVSMDRLNGIQNSMTIIIIVVPGGIVTSLLLLSIMTGLQNTIEELKVKKQEAKLEVYQRLRAGLGVIGFLMIAVVIYETLVIRRQSLQAVWETRYIYTDVLSHTLFFTILVMICFLWRPSERSRFMVYSEELSTDFNSVVEEVVGAPGSNDDDGTDDVVVVSIKRDGGL